MRGRPCLPGRGGHWPAPCAPGSKLHITEAAGSATTAQRGRPPSPAARGARFLLIQEKFLLQQDKVPDTEKHSVGARGSRRGPTRTRCRLSPEPGVWGQRRPRLAPAARRRRGEAPRLLPGPVPLSAAPGPTSRRGRSVWRHLPAHRKQQRQRQKKREHREGCGKRRNSPRRRARAGRSFIKVLPLYFPPR